MRHPAFAVVSEVQILPGLRVFGPGVYNLFSMILDDQAVVRGALACLSAPDTHSPLCARML